mgnify:CR=1 FL=1
MVANIPRVDGEQMASNELSAPVVEGFEGGGTDEEPPDRILDAATVASFVPEDLGAFTSGASRLAPPFFGLASVAPLATNSGGVVVRCV